MIWIPWQCGPCRTCMIMTSLDRVEGCADSRTPEEHSRPTPLKHLHLTLPQATGKPPEPAGSMHASVVPMGAFETQDGHIAVAAFNQRFWFGLCTAVGRPDLAEDPRYANLRERQRHRGALMAELSALFAT